jgi:hypothetical protein
VQQTAAVRVVQSVGDWGNDPRHLGGWNAIRVPVGEQPGGIGAVNEFHCDPQLAVEVATVVDGDDVRMAQRRHHLGFLVEPLPILLVVTDLDAEHLEGVVSRQPGVPGQVDLTHPTGAEDASDGVSGEDLAVS